VEYIPELQGHSDLVDEDSIISIASVLVSRVKLSDWVLLYNSLEHGCNLTTFFNQTRGQGPTLILFKDKMKHIFGAFVGDSWSKNEKSYYGLGDSFVFKLHPDFKAFHWTEKNDFFVENHPNDHISIGGGNGVAIYLDSEFLNGRSTVCDTFDNEPLASTEFFQCVKIECWGFSKYVLS